MIDRTVLPQKVREVRQVKSSAAGRADQSPLTPNSDDSRFSIMIILTAQKRDKKAETFPLENAVKSADVKIFIPISRKLKVKIKKPFLAMMKD